MVNRDFTFLPHKSLKTRGYSLPHEKRDVKYGCTHFVKGRE